jgi:predicted nucleotidyltransferase
MDAAFLSELKAAAAGVFSRRRILVAYAHGSRIQGRPRPESDLDIGYYLFPGEAEPALSIGDEMAMAADLSARLGLDVDLRCLNRAPLELRGRVLEEGVRVYSSDDPLRVSLECAILARYHDYKEVFQHMHAVRLRNRAARG